MYVSKADYDKYLCYPKAFKRSTAETTYLKH